ncbi:MAG TPA: AAA family ATPase [Ilumatobacter sp.]|nr:AAA family ATPase [Ilumatobacter sp.]
MRLLERDDHLGVLAAQLTRARDGRGGMAVVCGESGAGKSTLLQEFTDRIVDMTVLWGACDPLTTPRPLGPFHDLAAELGDVVTSQLRTASQPHEIFTAVFEQLRERPSVLVVDDLHWADQGTIDLLRFLLRRIRVTSSFVIGAFRDDEITTTHPLRSLLGDVARSPDAETATLRPLSVAAITELAENRQVDPAWLHRLTGGNPFFVVEMLDHAGEEIPRTVRDAILARTHGLSNEAWDLLHTLACAPEAIPDRLLADLGIGLDPLLEVNLAGLIRRGPRGVGFRHDLCRMAIGATLPPGGEVSLHRRMLDVLESSPHPDPAVLTHHALGAGDAARTRAHATEAGRVAARSGAHTQAAAFFATALEQPGAMPAADEAGLLELLARECYLLDRLADAIAASDRAMSLREQIHDPTGVSSNHHALAMYHWYHADRDLAVRHASAAEAVLEGDPAQRSDAELRELGHAVAMQAYLAMQSNDIQRARLLAAHASEVACVVDDPPLSMRAQLTRGICDMLDGDQRGRDATLSILDSASTLDEIHSSGYSNLVYLDVEQRRFRHAAEILGFTVPLTVERDLPICRVWQLGARARMKLLRGDWSDALADADSVLGRPSAPIARTWPHLVRGVIELRRHGGGDVDIDAAWDLAVRLDEPIRLFPAAAAVMERAWLNGVADGRVEACRELLATAFGPGLEWGRGELATWLCRLDPGAGTEMSIDVTAMGVAEPFRLQLRGDFDGAAARWSALSAPYDQALALVDAGTTQSTRVGLDLLDRLGADHVAAKVRLDLRRGGAVSVPARRRSATLANPAGLTTRQVEILALVADGSTNAEIANRLFISAKTVDHHVSAVLAKLQVVSRRDAVRRAGELGIVGSPDVNDATEATPLDR